MDQKREKIYIGIIIALLIFTYYTRSLQSGDLQRIENSLHNIRHELSSEVGRIEHQVSQIREEERWWSSGSMEFDRKEGNLQEVTAEWHIRDYRDGEQVYFHYLPTGEEDYQQVEMEEVSNGLFRGVFELEMTIEPEIRMHYSSSSPTDRMDEVEAWASEEERHEFLRHYVSTEFNGERRTTGEELMHFSGMQFELYHPVHINVHYGGGNEPEYNVNVDVDRYHHSPKYQLEIVETFLLKAGNEVRDLEMEGQDASSHQHYQKSIPVDEEEYDEILLRFTYDNGEVFERSVKVGEGQ